MITLSGRETYDRIAQIQNLATVARTDAAEALALAELLAAGHEVNLTRLRDRSRYASAAASDALNHLDVLCSALRQVIDADLVILTVTKQTA